MSRGMVKLNKAKCLECGDILISKEIGKVETCSCGSLSIGGGSYYLERRGSNKYREMSIMIDISEFNPNENIGTAPPKM
jgi:hypothetical protein